MSKCKAAQQSSEEAIHSSIHAQTMEDISQKIHCCKYFFSLDQSSDCWNIEIHPDSVHPLNFNTPFGRYTYIRHPFGIVSSQDVFQRAVEETFGDIPDAYCIADNVLTAATTRSLGLESIGVFLSFIVPFAFRSQYCALCAIFDYFLELKLLFVNFIL